MKQARQHTQHRGSCFFGEVLNSAGFFLVSLFLVSFFLSGAAFASDAGVANPGPGLPLLYQGINFLIFASLLVYFLKKPLRDFFKDRSLDMQQAILSSRQQHDEALREYQEIQQKLASLDRDAESIRQRFLTEGRSERDRILRDAEHSAEKLKLSVKHYLDAELIRTKEDLKQSTLKLSRSLALNLLQTEVTGEDEAGIQGRYLNHLRETVSAVGRGRHV